MHAERRSCLYRGRQRAARGAEALDERWSNERDLPVKRFLAQWEQHSCHAGPLRKPQVAEYATHLVVFQDGQFRGMKNMVETAQAYDLKIRVIRINLGS